MSPVKIGAGKYINRLKNRVSVLLPDTCEIFALEVTETDSGAWEETLSDTGLLYRGDTNVPCRVDPTSHHREDDVFIQEKIVNEYMLWIPYDAPIFSNHKVSYKNKLYDIRKIVEDHSWGLLKSALIVEVQ